MYTAKSTNKNGNQKKKQNNNKTRSKQIHLLHKPPSKLKITTDGTTTALDNFKIQY